MDVECVCLFIFEEFIANSGIQRNRLHIFPCNGRFVVRRWETRDEPCLAPNIFRPFSSFPIQGTKATEFRQDQAECQRNASPWTECASHIAGGRFGQPIKHPDRPFS